MGHRRNSGKRGGIAASVAAAALVLGGIPTASFALEALGGPARHLDGDSAFPFTPATADPRLAKVIAERADGSAHLMRFTPAGVAGHADRAVTVAVRIDEQAAHAIEVRSAIEAARDQMSGESGVRIAPVRYNLGLLRGYQGFAQLAQPSVLSKTLSDAAIPDLSAYRPSPVPQSEPSRFAGKIALQHDEKPGSSPRTHDALGEQSVDLAESYRLTRNLDVTAGLRYSQQHDRLTSLNDRGQQDSQAVYVGTQFRF
jgi:hypothetical protein